jgi:hypothetical protein
MLSTKIHRSSGVTRARYFFNRERYLEVRDGPALWRGIGWTEDCLSGVFAWLLVGAICSPGAVKPDALKIPQCGIHTTDIDSILLSE